MQLTAWLIGDGTESILDDLTAADGYPPAQVWVPLETSDVDPAPRLCNFRSAWAHRTIEGEEWVDFALPAEAILEAIGPHALAYPKSLTHGKALRSNVEIRDGTLMAKVPRFFSTVATAWDFERLVPHPLITRRGVESNEATIGELNLRASFRQGRGEPRLIVDKSGPRALARHRRVYYAVSGTTFTDRVLTEIRKLPRETPIRCVVGTAQN